jgi:hypothetical protein
MDLAPDYIFRLHAAAINSLHFSADNGTLVSV